MAHTCHAHGCGARVPPRIFMCRPHWYSLRKELRDAIWHEYRAGQERDKNPSARYMAVQRRAVAEVAFEPHDEEAAKVVMYYVEKSEEWRARAITRGEGDPLEGIVKNEPFFAGEDAGFELEV